MVNRVEGQELASKQTVNPIETVNSPNLKDRRRHNDDSKHQDKVARHSAMWARKKAANDMLMDPALRDPLNHYAKSTHHGSKIADYTQPASDNLRKMNEMHRIYSGTATPAEHLSPPELHRDPQAHD